MAATGIHISPPPIRTEVIDDKKILTYPWQKWTSEVTGNISSGGGGGGQGATGLQGIQGSAGKPGAKGDDGQPGAKGDQGVTGLAGLGVEADNLAYSWMVS